MTVNVLCFCFFSSSSSSKPLVGASQVSSGWLSAAYRTMQSSAPVPERALKFSNLGTTPANDDHVAEVVMGANDSAHEPAAPTISCEVDAVETVEKEFSVEPSEPPKSSQRSLSRSRSRERKGVWIQSGSRKWILKI